MVTKAVLPVAGLGTRFLPASKAIPKEMVTVVDKPVIQYVVEEALAAGINEIVLVTHSSKKAIEDHFDVNYELEAELERRGKQELLQVLRDIAPPQLKVTAVRQGRALGLGHAVYCARPVVGDAPFAVMLPDVLVEQAGDVSDLGLMTQRFADTGRAQIMVEPVPVELVHQYGVVDLNGADLQPAGHASMTRVVEKPPREQAPSNLAIVGRYVLPAGIFDLLANTAPGAGGEIQLTDAIAELMKSEGVEAWHIAGRSYDCGSKLGYLEATLAYGVQHPQLGADFRALLARYQAEG
ncbi:UTP--glucose-1-phosphate uridylyltransferase [Pseudomonas sp. G11-1]|uniref:UTP--glucose-1-phosphate uridylyltransferase n=1 Tax=Halopseudomonas bauzanensis TaxID=653930 RepID=A0A4U0YGG5_9GAMM|nr:MULTISPECIES: UTP--glucose-1-phosphate uridylyltransferase GalU [Halopseudomonas]MCO5786172.1 UTP--glucose-1-phosphate uridylyltransferase [Pseudomonas sp. G11-1]MCO5789398.1 UTP--glucose-1-phosphate uridylyltransferase [Pseudomonas sp. G11-2]TKA90168.1 UTP--glucose-1-phosphate uridylyltransferase GalU [Halopseudomonas bauzanensis]WGK62896.1 UTP--glucose-1-phosphate uridylyltransferase GalU [Halopseudomonas sp. SMJS2]